MALRTLFVILAVASLAHACKTFNSVNIVGDWALPVNNVVKNGFMHAGISCVYRATVSDLVGNTTYNWAVIVDGMTVLCDGKFCSFVAGPSGEVDLFFEPTNMTLHSVEVATVTKRTVYGQVWYYNNCGNTVNVIATPNGLGGWQAATLGAHGGTTSTTFGLWGGNIKNGWGGLTLAEFEFNSWNGLDFYDISIIVGYDTPMQIQAPNGGAQLTCTGPGCSQAYLFPSDDTKTHSTPTGGWFGVVFCP